MVSGVAIVRHIQGLLANPDNWLQNGYARDGDGNRVSPSADTACKFCLLGALHRSKHDLGIDVFSKDYQRAFLALIYAAREMGSTGIITFNDSPNIVHNDVLTLLQKAEEAQANGEKRSQHRHR